MGVNVLQQQAFFNSVNFTQQVNAAVMSEALYKADPEHTPGINGSGRNQLANVVKNPAGYGFTQTIIADAGWGLTYDTWATNPNAQEGAILAGVQKAWPLLVGETYVDTP
jgi:hypothetical protein